MKQVQKILVPVDFSEKSANALSYAFSLAQEMKAELVALHVFENKERPSFLELYATLEGWPIRANSSTRIPVDIWLREKSLDLYNFIETVLRNPDMSRIKRRLRIGRPVKEIVAVAKEEAIDLIVLESQKKSLFSYLTARGTFLRLISKIPFPVLLTPPSFKKERAPGGSLRFLPVLKPPQS